ncbi:MAG: hypothetical protein ACRDPA_06050, partial [Solirubrobacteraceae bacterium]
VVIAIAMVALAVLHHGRPAPPSTTPSGPGGGSPRAELIRTFGVLRQTQTKADLDRELLGLYLPTVDRRNGTIPPGPFIPLSRPAAALPRWGYPALDRQLARTVKIPAWRAKVLIAPTTFQPAPSSPDRSEGVNLALWIGTQATIPPSSLSGTGPRPTSVGTVLAHGLALADVVHGTNTMDGVIAVPDGVASVKLGPFVSLPHETPPSVGTKALNAALAAIQTSATVHDNIGAFQLPMPVVTSRRRLPHPPGAPPGFALFGIGTKAQDAWLNSHGQVIKRTTTEVDLIVRVKLKRTG